MGHPKLNGGTAYTWLDSLHTISTNPLTRNRIRYSIYVMNDYDTIEKRTFSDELLHAEGQGHYSLWPYHVETQTGVTSLATQTSPDESYIAGIWQALKTGTNIKNHKDTIKTIIEIAEKLSVLYNDGWNMVSVPTTEADMSADAIFPEKTGSAFEYNSSYTIAETLKNGIGYWIKLGEGEEKEFQGTKRELDTIDVIAKWNMIGSIGYPVPVDSIQEIPPNIIISNIFGYDGTYKETDTLQPGKAYWIKISEEGKLVIKKPGTGATATYKNIPRNIDISEIPDTPNVTNDVKGANQAYPRVFTLSQNYPNPFNPSTQIGFGLSTKSDVSLSVYNMLGQEVARLINESLPAGSYSVTWNVVNEPSSVYYYRLVTGEFTSVKRMVLVR